MIRNLAIFSIVYLAIASVCVVAVRGEAVLVFESLIRSVLRIGSLVGPGWPLVILILISAMVLMSPRLTLRRLILAVYLIMVCTIFLAGFMLFKKMLPLLAEGLGLKHFFADPLLLSIDRSLHLGVDPWQIAFVLTDAANWDGLAGVFSFLYGPLWVVPAFYLPAIFYLFDGDTERTRRLTILYVACWIFLGNIIALLLLSSGPVYFDRIFEEAQFPGLHEALAASGFSETRVGAYQEYLFADYVNETQRYGTGISAFPSLHVAMATLFAIFLAEKSRLLAPVGFVWVALTLFISVWVGYHYAIDGYFAIIAVMVGNALLKRKAADT